MNFTVYYFGEIREFKQISKEEFNKEISIRELLQTLKLPMKFLVSINLEYEMNHDRIIKFGDEVGLIPSVSGG
jgi:molybdopterin converting factor small subunit